MLNWSTHKPSDVPVILNAIAHAYMNSRRHARCRCITTTSSCSATSSPNTQRELRNTDGEIDQVDFASGLTTLDDTRWSAVPPDAGHDGPGGEVWLTSLNIAQSGLNLVRQQIEGRIQPNPDDRVIAERDPTLQNFSQSLEYQKAQYRELSEERMPGDQMLIDMDHSAAHSQCSSRPRCRRS